MCLNVFDEYCIESRLGAGEKEFVRWGLTDSMLLLLGNNPSLVLVTADLGLWLAATERVLNALNFAHNSELNFS